MNTYNDYHIVPTIAATEVGMVPAMILNYIAKWVIHNRKFRKNYRDGRYWTYNSIRAYGEVFPYLSTHQLRQAFALLEKEGYIETATYNELHGDRTKWYTITDKAEVLLKLRTQEEIDSQIVEVPDGEKAVNPFAEKCQPICQNGTTICQNGTSNTNNITQENKHKKVVELHPTSERAKKVKVEESNNEFRDSEYLQELGLTDFEEKARAEEKKNIKALINGKRKTNEDLIDFYQALFWEPDEREVLNLGILECKYGYERVYDALVSLNNPYIDTVKNPLAVIKTVIDNQKKL